MTKLRLHFRFLLLLVPVALAWTQYVTAEHEWVDHAVMDDCVICKIVENGSDKANLVDIAHGEHFSADSVSAHFFDARFYSSLWDTPQSRAPPIS